MPTASLDGLIFFWLSIGIWIATKQQTHKNQHMALRAIHQCILQTNISSHVDNKG
jgi:hypothetical protein